MLEGLIIFEINFNYSWDTIIAHICRQSFCFFASCLSFEEFLPLMSIYPYDYLRDACYIFEEADDFILS